MSQVVHTVSAVPGAQRLALGDRLQVGLLNAVANAAGGSAGAAVAVAITGLTLPAKYVVLVSASQNAGYYITGKTSSGFTVNLFPGNPANTLGAGTFDVAIFA